MRDKIDLGEFGGPPRKVQQPLQEFKRKIVFWTASEALVGFCAFNYHLLIDKFPLVLYLDAKDRWQL